MRALLQFLAIGFSLVFASPSLYAEVVNLNKADAETLQKHLQGIGPVKSQAIVDYRKKHGSYKNLDDLLKVEGIGPKLLEKNQKNLSLNRGVSKTEKQEKSSQRKQTDKTTDAQKSSKVTSSRESTKSSDAKKPSSTEKKKTSKERYESTGSSKEKHKSSKTGTKEKKSAKNKSSSTNKKSSKTTKSENKKKSSDSKTDK